MGKSADGPDGPGWGGIPPLRILIVEDNVDAAETLRMVLELEGHAVAVALDGRTGIDRCRSFDPDLVLCDLGLPVIDGFGVARALSVGDPAERPLLVAVSGYAFADDLRRSSQAGFDVHVAKPVSPERLRRILAAAADRRSRYGAGRGHYGPRGDASAGGG